MIAANETFASEDVMHLLFFLRYIFLAMSKFADMIGRHTVSEAEFAI